MKCKIDFTDKDLTIFSGFAILAVIYIVSMVLKKDIIYIRAAINYISFNLILYAIIQKVQDYFELHIKELELSGKVGAVPSIYVNLKKETDKCSKKVFVWSVVCITILTGVQIIIKGVVGNVLGDAITFFAFLLSCESSVIIDIVCLQIQKKVFK